MRFVLHADRSRLRAAQGWFELGNLAEANNELMQISDASRDHPDVLKLRCQIYAKAREWAVCLELSKTIHKLTPTDPFGLLHAAESLHHLSRDREAFEVLLPGSVWFPEHAEVFLKLAEYAGRLGWEQVSRELSSRALACQGRRIVRRHLLENPEWSALGEHDPE